MSLFSYIFGFAAVVVSGLGFIFDEVMRGDFTHASTQIILIAALILPVAIGTVIVFRRAQKMFTGGFSVLQDFIRTIVLYVMGNVLIVILSPLVMLSILGLGPEQTGAVAALILGVTYITASTYIGMMFLELARRYIGKYNLFTSRPASTVLAVLYGAGGLLLALTVAYQISLRGFAATDSILVVFALGLCIKAVYRAKISILH